jgi:hypothetical protein
VNDAARLRRLKGRTYDADISYISHDETDAFQIARLHDGKKSTWVVAPIENDRRVSALAERLYNPRTDTTLRSGYEIGLGHLLRDLSLLLDPVKLGGVSGEDAASLLLIEIREQGLKSFQDSIV